MLFILLLHIFRRLLLISLFFDRIYLLWLVLVVMALSKLAREVFSLPIKIFLLTVTIFRRIILVDTLLRHLIDHICSCFLNVFLDLRIRLLTVYVLFRGSPKRLSINSLLSVFKQKLYLLVILGILRHLLVIIIIFVRVIFIWWILISIVHFILIYFRILIILIWITGLIIKLIVLKLV